MFHFPSFASGTYVFSAGSRGFAAGGFPIRKSPGQSLLGGSPELIAACHVLHRLLTPGHPPCALIHLTTTQRMNVFRTHSRIGFQRTRAAQQRARTEKIEKTADRYIPFTARLRSLPHSETEASELRRATFALRAKVGGGERDRTDGLLVANQALSQLSYTPESDQLPPRDGTGACTPPQAHPGSSWWA